MAHLSAEESTVMDSIIAEMGTSMSLSQMLRRWSSFVREVELGYSESIYDYTNELSVRDLIARVLELAPPAVSEKLESHLNPIDERFLGATSESNRPLSLSDATGLSRWWYRIPIKCGSELAGDLRSEGLIN
jgi:hypothetical protein